MVNKIVLVKPLILKYLNKENNNHKVENGVFIHKKCNLRANALLKKIPETSHFENENDNLIPETTHFENENDNLILSENIYYEEDYNDCSGIVEQLEVTLGETNSEAQSSIEQKVDMSILKGNSSHKYCFVCHAEKNKMVTIQSNPRYEILAKTNTFIVKGSRLCRSHIDEKGFVFEQDLALIKSSGTINFDEEGIKELVDHFQLSRNSSQIFSQFSPSSPIHDNSLRLIGFSKYEFLYMVQYLNGLMNDSNKRTKEQALFVYLFWLRSGFTMEVKILYLSNFSLSFLFLF